MQNAQFELRHLKLETPTTVAEKLLKFGGFCKSCLKQLPPGYKTEKQNADLFAFPAAAVGESVFQ